MSDRDPKSVKRRLAGEGRPPPEIGRVTPELALRVALTRASEDCLAMEVFAKSVVMRRRVVSSLVEELPEYALIALLAGPGKRLGLAILDSQMLAGVIEKQTTGRVVPKAAEGRIPTRTDAVMCNDVLNAILQSFQAEGEEAALPLTSTWSGFEYLLPLEDARAIQMTLEDIPYRVFEAVLDLEKGAKEGRILLVFPHDPPRTTHAQKDRGEATGEGVLTEIVQDTRLEMEAVIHRLDLTVSEVASLAVGSLVPVPREAIVQISVEDLEGKRVCFGRLGAQTGYRAIRLNLSDTPDELELPSVATGIADPRAIPAAPMSLDSEPVAGGLDEGQDEILSGLPSLDGLPDLPAMGGEGEMIGELPPIEGLGDLPDLPDLPALDPAQ